MIVSARFGVLDEILKYERSHASLSEESSTGAESASEAQAPLPGSGGPAGLSLSAFIILKPIP